jgi:acyl-[acyl carrier protein]--UDP-N-acetylglucosamine O-acyltransferase
MTRVSIHALRSAFRCLHTHRTIPAAVAAITATVPDAAEVRELLQFIATSKRGIQPSLRFSLYDRGRNDEET